ncbi:MAG: PTS sugar transporter subunit IIA [Gammaproteobacteria bacterium]|nr:PTS sugar transporter subunit IIA [Gammaproteobacteria bacterium]
MAVAVLVVTHGRIGEELLASSMRILGQNPLPCASFSVEQNCDPERVARELAARIGRIDEGDGVLVLVDLYGATPANVVRRVREARPCAIVTGVNLPMLLKVFNYAGAALAALAEKACDGGRDGVLHIPDGDF